MRDNFSGTSTGLVFSLSNAPTAIDTNYDTNPIHFPPHGAVRLP